MRSPRILLVLVSLAVAVYAPFLALPFLANSFIEIPVSRVLAAWHSFPLLLQNANWHFRISYVFLNSWLLGWQGLNAQVFYAASIGLHAACVVIIYLMGRWRVLSYRAAGWAAAFFAIYSAHHGPVVSLSFWPGVLVTLFTGAAFLFWIRWMQAGRWLSYSISLLVFLAALVSQETGFITPLLFLLALFVSGKMTRKNLISLIPFAALSIGALAVQIAARPRPVPWETSLPVLDAFWITAIWTAAVAGGTALLRPAQWQRMTVAMVIWVSAVLASGAYLVFFLHITRDVVYLASLGLALLFGYMFDELQKRAPVRLVLAVGVFVLVLNTTLLWTFARRQVMSLAAPTDALLNAAVYARQPIRMTCFPFPFEIAEAVAGTVGARVVSDKPDAVWQPHCVSFSYTDSAGNVRNVFLHSRF